MGAAALLVVGGMMLLGIPGGIFAFLAEVVVAPLKGLPQGGILVGDQAWPAAIWMTLLVPPAIPLIHWLVLWRKPDWNGWLQALAIVAGTYAWSVIVLFAIS